MERGVPFPAIQALQSAALLQKHCYMHRQHISQAVLTRFSKAFPVACMSSFKEGLSSSVHPPTCPAGCDHPWKHSLSLIPRGCSPPTIPWGVLGFDLQCLYKWLLHSSIPLAPVYAPAGKKHHPRSCFSDTTLPA